MLKKIKILSGLLLVLSIILIYNITPLQADEELAYEPYIIVSSYRVSDDVIVPGKKFNLIVELENTVPKVSVAGALVTINFSEGISTAYKTPNQIYISNLEGGEKREVTFELYASPYYAYSSVAFGVSINTELRSNYVTLYAPVQLGSNPFKIVSQTVPEKANAGDKISVSFSFKSLLEEKLSNVVLSVFLDKDEKPVTTTNIGNIYAEAAKTQNVTFFINEPGKHSVRFVLSYSTYEGETSTAELYSGTINIEESSEDIDNQVNEIPEPSMTDRDKLIFFGCLGLSFLLAIGIVLIAKKYN